MGREMEPHILIERSIAKKYRKSLWNPFIAAVRQYELIKEGDKIAVCISGGKDSMLMAKLMQMLQRISDTPFDLVYLVMDPGYNESNRRMIERNAALLHIQTFSLLQTALIKPLAISAQECAEVIFTARQKSYAATKSRLDIISAML